MPVPSAYRKYEVDGLTVEATFGSDLHDALNRLDEADCWQIVDSIRERATDGRWCCGLVTVVRDGDLVGAMPLSGCSLARVPDGNVRLVLQQLNGADHCDALFLGGHAYLMGGAAVRSPSDRGEPTPVIRLMVHAGLDVARTLNRRPFALYVPQSQRDAFASSWPSSRLAEARARAGFRFRPGEELSTFLARLPRDHRKTWRRDLRRSIRLDRSVEAVELDAAVVRESAPLIASIKVRHGVVDHPRLTEMRLARWLAETDLSRIKAWLLRDESQRILGMVVGRIADGGLVMCELGLEETAPQRGDIYLHLSIVVPVLYCLDNGLGFLDLGSGHLEPKTNRGAELTRQWHVIGE